jgi:hypothetical protein
MGAVLQETKTIVAAVDFASTWANVAFVWADVPQKATRIACVPTSAKNKNDALSTRENVRWSMKRTVGSARVVKRRDDAHLIGQSSNVGLFLGLIARKACCAHKKTAVFWIAVFVSAVRSRQGVQRMAFVLPKGRLVWQGVISIASGAWLVKNKPDAKQQRDVAWSRR